MCNSRRNAMQVSPRPRAQFSADLFIFSIQGLLPIFYNFLRSFQKPPSPESQDDHPAQKLEPLVGWRCALLWLPALCDLTGTTVRSFLAFPIGPLSLPPQLMNIGLLYTPVSIYQMTRGSLVLFVGVLSVFFLRRHLWLYQFCSFPPNLPL
jgi:drug/metabolite transporter (DMT)-like permease